MSKKLEDLAEMFCYGATKQPVSGDVAVMRVGAKAGTQILLVNEENVSTITKNYIGIRCKDSALTHKIYEILTSDKSKKSILELRKGVAILSIPLKSLKDFEIDL